MRRILFLSVALLCAGWCLVRQPHAQGAAMAQAVPATMTPHVLATVAPRLRPTRPPRVRPVRRPRLHPTPTPTGTPLPTPTQTPRRPAVTDCAHACHYTVSQMRMLWYGGLSFTAVIKNGGCDPLTPEAGESGTVQIDKFLTAQHHDTGFQHRSTFVLGANGVGENSLNGMVQFSPVVDSYTFSYSAPVSAVANIRAGPDFPVELTLCLTLGDQAVKMHLVCQGKNQGMLCHEG